MSKELDRINYSEGVKIAIGDYESRDVHISYTTTVRKTEKPKESIARAKKTVQMSLRKAEKRIREVAEDEVDFESLDRLNYYSK